MGRPLNYYDRIVSRLKLYFTGNDALFVPLFLYRPELNGSVTAVIEERLSALVKLWDEGAPHPKGTSHWVNWLISAHIPAYLFAKRSQGPAHMIDVYRKKLAPEFFTERRPIFSMAVKDIQNEIASAWGFEPSAHLNSSVEKLLKKGAYLPTSIRYGEGQILKCGKGGGMAEKVVRAICLSEMLSLYTFNNEVKPLHMHIKLNETPTSELAVLMCKDKTSRQLYQCICRFLVAATAAFLPLYATTSRIPELTKHIAETMAGEIISPAKPAYTTGHMWSSLKKAIRIRSKIPADIIQRLGENEIRRICSIMGGSAVFKGPRLNAKLMGRAGISPKCAAALRQFGPLKSPSPKVMRSLVLSLSPDDQARLFVALLAVSNQSLMPQRFFLGSNVASVQKEQCMSKLGVDSYPVFICMTCFLWRSHVERADKSRNFNPEKSKSGVYASWAGPCCRNCGSLAVACVDLVGHRVKALLRCTDSARRDIMLCSNCIMPTAQPHISGDLPFCKQCYVKAKQMHQGVCMCGVIHSFGQPQTLINTKGEYAVYQFCPTHYHLRPDNIVPVPLQLIRKSKRQFERDEAKRMRLGD